MYCVCIRCKILGTLPEHHLARVTLLLLHGRVVLQPHVLAHIEVKQRPGLSARTRHDKVVEGVDMMVSPKVDKGSVYLRITGKLTKIKHRTSFSVKIGLVNSCCIMYNCETMKISVSSRFVTAIQNKPD